MLIFISFLLLSFAQPDISPFCCVLTSAFGYALFWKGIISFSNRKKFWLSFFWFALIESFHLSWFTADRYVGSLIYLFLAILVFVLGLSFALFSLLIKKNLSFKSMLGVAALWTIMEWSRLFFLSGFPWDPAGLSLSATLPGLQFATIGGMFGMTFWVIVSNLIALKLFSSFSKQRLLSWLVVTLFPYFFGALHLMVHSKKMSQDQTPPLSVLLLQSSLYPEEKTWLPQSHSPPLSHFFLWQHHFDLLKKHEGKPIDLIVFPESAVPWGTTLSRQELRIFFPNQEMDREKFSNVDLSQLIAKKSGADVVIGLENVEKRAAHNAAFFFSADSTKRGRYEKRILVPMGEYIPFEWCKTILKKYGIQDSFTPGKEPKIFDGKAAKLGVTICYEEIYGHLMRENRLKGATLLVNLTNDVWYPHSRLAMVHYLHSRLRAVEMGIPLVRATNTGMTVGLDSLGRVRGILPHETKKTVAPADSLHVLIPRYTYKTFYTLVGDWGVITLSFAFVLNAFVSFLWVRARARV